MNAVDTNVLVYAQDPRDPVKRQIAIELVRNLSDAALLWQVACEYIAASRKLVPYGFSQSEAWQDVAVLRAGWKTALPSWRVYEHAEALMTQGGFSFWDGLLIAACLETGVETLYSDDLGGRPPISGLSLINPFATSK